LLPHKEEFDHEKHLSRLNKFNFTGLKEKQLKLKKACQTKSLHTKHRPNEFQNQGRDFPSPTGTPCANKSHQQMLKNFINKNIPRRAKKKASSKHPFCSLAERLLSALSLDASGRFKCAISFVNIRQAAADQNTRRRVIRKKRPRKACARLLNKSLSLALSLVRAARFAFLCGPASRLFCSASQRRIAAAYRNPLSVCASAESKSSPFKAIFYSVCVCWNKAKQKLHQNPLPWVM